MTRIPILLLLIASVLGAFAAAGSAPTFCKCTCFSNSTIIPLGKAPPPPSPEQPPPKNGDSSPSTSPPPAQSSGLNQQPPPDVAGAAPKPGLDLSLGRHDEPGGGGLLAGRDVMAGVPATAGWLERRVPASGSSCAQCNRAFCLGYNLPICRGADEAKGDVQALCFQRDSRKDEIIVWGFILGTTGLLGWAAVRKVLQGRMVIAANGGGVGNGAGDAARGAYQAVGAR